MDGSRFIADLEARGIAIWRENDSIKVRPASQLNAEDDAMILSHKPDLLAALAESDARLCECAEERAATQEYEGGLSRRDAEAAAREYRRVRCSDCRHFQRDQVGDGSGIGSCGQGIVPPLSQPPMYPGARRCCDEFQAKEAP